MTIAKSTFLLSFPLLLLLAQLQVFSQSQIPASVLSSGGEQISSTRYILNSTVGEPFIGKSLSASYQQYSGFWYVYEQSTITEVEADEGIPISYKLEQNYPNPFNPSTIIKFGVPERGTVLIKIYDILGNEVAVLVNEEMEAGWYRREFNAGSFSSGIYICRMQSGTYTNTKKMLMIK
jgi:hypothetical protein